MKDIAAEYSFRFPDDPVKKTGYGASYKISVSGVSSSSEYLYIKIVLAIS